MANLVQKFMDEHIYLPGVCDVVVTRGFAYQWLKKCGYNPSDRGFGSLDYMVGAAPKVNSPLTIIEGSTAIFLTNVREAIKREFV